MRSSRGRKKKTIKEGHSMKNPFALQKEIEGWGFHYSLKMCLLQIAVVLIGIAVIGRLYMLSDVRMVILAIAAIAAFPVIVRSQYRFLAGNRDFREAVQYMEQMVLFFKQSPKILSSMKNTMITAEGALKERIQEAIFIIENDVSGDDVFEKAFEKMESAYPCARMRSMHKFMIQVEMGNSLHYQQGADSMYFDIQSWVERVYRYQKELSNIKNKLSIVLLLSIGIAAFFSRLLLKAEESLPSQYGMHLVDSLIYQNAALIYLLLFILLFVLLTSKITGSWLVNDIKEDGQEEMLKRMEYVEDGNLKKRMRKSALMSLCGVIIAGGSMVLHFRAGIVAGLVLAILILIWPGVLLRKRKKMVERTLMKDFPIWMREVSIHLYDMVPMRAIAMTMDTASMVMKNFLTRFLEQTERDPASLEPYLNIFRIYRAEELTASFKTLFTIRNLSADDAQRQITELVRRNQKQLEQGERLRNEDYLAGVTFLSIFPMLLMSLYLMTNLLLILGGFLSLSKGVF